MSSSKFCERNCEYFHATYNLVRKKSNKTLAFEVEFYRHKTVDVIIASTNLFQQTILVKLIKAFRRLSKCPNFCFEDFEKALLTKYDKDNKIYKIVRHPSF